MKNIAVAVLMLLASANAMPSISERELRQERFINEIIIEVIENLIQRIVERGLDPLVVPTAEVSYALSEPEIFTGSAWVRNLLATGLSNININSLNFSILSQTLTFDISLPRLSAYIGEAGVRVSTFGRLITAGASGSLEVREIRLTGTVRVSVGVISGISVRSISLSFTLGGINADLNIVVLDRDLSETVNKWLNETLPNALKESQKEVNDLLEYLAWYLVNRILDLSAFNLALQA